MHKLHRFEFFLRLDILKMSHQEEGQYGCQCSSCVHKRRDEEVIRYIINYIDQNKIKT